MRLVLVRSKAARHSLSPLRWMVLLCSGLIFVALGDLQSARRPLAQLEIKRSECGADCPEDLETAYLDLNKSNRDGQVPLG